MSLNRFKKLCFGSNLITTSAAINFIQQQPSEKMILQILAMKSQHAKTMDTWLLKLLVGQEGCALLVYDLEPRN